MKRVKPKITRKRIVVASLVFVLVVVVLFLALGGVKTTKRIYYGYKSRTALSNENKKLGEPLKALGFTSIEGGNSVCQYFEKFGYENKPLDCTTTLKSYQVFSDDAAKSRAAEAAGTLSRLLKQNGWQQGNYEVGKWFQDVTNKVDWNPDAYHYKYFDDTFCMLDFFVAYSNPNPPAVNAEMRCTVPEIHPPIFD